MIISDIYFDKLIFNCANYIFDFSSLRKQKNIQMCKMCKYTDFCVNLCKYTDFYVNE